MPYLLGLVMTFLFIFLKHLLQILNCSYQIQQSFTFFYLISNKFTVSVLELCLQGFVMTHQHETQYWPFSQKKCCVTLQTTNSLVATCLPARYRHSHLEGEIKLEDISLSSVVAPQHR